MLVSHLALALIALASEVLARDSRPSTTCSTKYGPNTMRRVPTYSSSTTKTLTRTRCTIQKIASTVTPDRETETVQVTEIATATVTADPGVQTATTTVVDTSTITSINSHYGETVTNTITETSTSFGSSTTVPTPSGFIPINQGRNYRERVRREDDDQLEEEYEEEKKHGLERRRGELRCKKGRNGFEFYPKQYPNRVDCTKTEWKTAYITTTKTQTGKPTTLRPETTTVTSTNTNTITETEYPPDVTNTVTESTTAVVTTYTDVFITATEQATTTVVEIAVQTSYAACNRDNLVYGANNGKAITQLSLGREVSTYGVGGVSTAYECCAACHASAGSCQGSVFLAADRPGGRATCMLLMGDTCAPGQDNGVGYGTTDFRPGYTVSSGPCGTMYNQGHFS